MSCSLNIKGFLTERKLKRTCWRKTKTQKSTIKLTIWIVISKCRPFTKTSKNMIKIKTMELKIKRRIMTRSMDKKMQTLRRRRKRLINTEMSLWRLFKLEMILSKMRMLKQTVGLT